MSMIRTRWAAVGAAVAITLGAGGIGLVDATSPSGASAFVPITPCRLADTRPNTIGADSTMTFEGWGTTGACTLPTGTTGLALNVTAVGATQQTNLRFHPTGTSTPATANLNPTPGAPPTPNAVNVTLNATNGRFDVYNRFGSVAVVIDVMGYYTDHHHDDRYYTQTELDAVHAAKADAADVYTKSEVDAKFASTVDLQIGIGQFAADNDTVNWTNGCVRQDAAPNIIRSGVTLPRGATIQSLTGLFFNGTGGPAELRLVRATTGATTMVTVTNTGQTASVENFTEPLATPEVVDENDYFWVDYDAPDGSGQLCGVAIQYTVPAGFSLSAAPDAGPTSGPALGQD